MSRSSQHPSVLYRAAAEELRDNEGQWKAYESAGNFVVLAGPGSGKTKVLTLKMARMLAEDVRPPRGIACITFNTECARELSSKMAQLGVRPRREVFIGTVHGFCLQHLLRPFRSLTDVGLPPQFAIAGSKTKEDTLQRALDAVLGRPEEARRYATGFDRYRRTHLDRTDPSWRKDDAEMAQVVESYEEKLHASSLIDFDDMILGGLRILQKHTWAGQAVSARFPILLIDEYQDLGLPLHELVLCLKEQHSVRIFAVGDPDQSIYGFTGAQSELLPDLAGMPGVGSTRLRLNYRSRRAIVRGAKIVIQEDRDYEPVDKDEGIVDFIQCPDGLQQQATTVIDEIIPAVLAESSARTRSDVAVLYANRNVGDAIADALDAKGWGYVRIDQGAAYLKTPFARWLEDCAAWCAGGWRRGEPSLTTILDTWADLRKLTAHRRERWRQNMSLVRFLWKKRDAEELLGEWLADLFGAVISSHVGDDAVQLDDRETWQRIVAATSAGRPLQGHTISQFGRQGGDSEQLNLITLHSSKGLEFQVVIMMGLDQGIIPSWSAGPGAKREQRRLFYVGLTRAKHEVYMMYSGFHVDRYDRVHQDGPSEFLLGLREQLEIERHTV